MRAAWPSGRYCLELHRGVSEGLVAQARDSDVRRVGLCGSGFVCTIVLEDADDGEVSAQQGKMRSGTLSHFIIPLDVPRETGVGGVG